MSEPVTQEQVESVLRALLPQSVVGVTRGFDQVFVTMEVIGIGFITLAMQDDETVDPGMIMAAWDVTVLAFHDVSTCHPNQERAEIATHNFHACESALENYLMSHDWAFNDDATQITNLEGDVIWER